MKKFFKIMIGLFIAMISIGLVATIALRYLDVLLGFFHKGEYIEDDCCCDCEEFE